MGNLIDSPEEALRLPFVFADDPARMATAGEIREDWQRVKDRQDLRARGGGFFRDVALLRLPREAIDELIASKLENNEQILKAGTQEFAELDTWPADAQLGLHSMAWAMGPAFAQAGHFPKFRAACGNLDFWMAAEEAKIKEAGNPGLIPRNQANKILFLNAGKVIDGTAPDPNPEILWYPQNLAE